MKKDTAALLVDKILQVDRCIGEMCQALHKEQDTDNKFYIRALASALADISGQVLIPIANLYPDLIDLSKREK